MLQTVPHYQLKTFHGGEFEQTLICYMDKIVVPNDLQKQMVQWYHNTLCHLGMTRTEQTIRQHFWWKTLRENVQHVTYVSKPKLSIQNMDIYPKRMQNLNLGKDSVWT
jgi:Integrase zinc binding domain